MANPALIAPSYVRAMASYNAEMNRRLYSATTKLSDEERRQNEGAFWGSIHGTLCHLLWADTMWMSRLAGWPKPSVSLKQSNQLVDDFAELKARRVVADRRPLGLGRPGRRGLAGPEPDLVQRRGAANPGGTAGDASRASVQSPDPSSRAGARFADPGRPGHRRHRPVSGSRQHPCLKRRRWRCGTPVGPGGFDPKPEIFHGRYVPPLRDHNRRFDRYRLRTRQTLRQERLRSADCRRRTSNPRRGSTPAHRWRNLRGRRGRPGYDRGRGQAAVGNPGACGRCAAGQCGPWPRQGLPRSGLGGSQARGRHQHHRDSLPAPESRPRHAKPGRGQDPDHRVDRGLHARHLPGRL